MPAPLLPQRRRALGRLGASLGAGWWLLSQLAAAARPALMLANSYRPGLPVQDYWVSEKYDGVRGYWYGKALWTRGGEPIQPPAWFTEGWPPQALDGELWAGRGQFAQAVSTVRQQQAPDAAWQAMRFMVFDLPQHPGPFDARLAALQAQLKEPPSRTLEVVGQQRVASHTALQAMLDAVLSQGGEGLVLHRGSAPYRAVRSDDLLKFKPVADADAQVIGHLPGKGKYQGMLGALLLRTPEGLRFKLGSGLSDAQRLTPPPVGSWITYRYRERLPSGLPRFASYLREAEGPPQY